MVLTDEKRKELGFIKLQGKWYSTYKALLNVAHEQFKNKFSVQTQIISCDFEKKEALCKCVITLITPDGEKVKYGGYGDATTYNTSGMVQGAFVRMSETRSICRALRIMTNVAETAQEELGEETKK